MAARRLLAVDFQLLLCRSVLKKRLISGGLSLLSRRSVSSLAEQSVDAPQFDVLFRQEFALFSPARQPRILRKLLTDERQYAKFLSQSKSVDVGR
jgi:hypothetical protein